MIFDLRTRIGEVSFSGNENSRIQKGSGNSVNIPSFTALIDSGYIAFQSQTNFATLDTGSFPTNTCLDYYIFAGLVGGDPAIRISASKTSPTGMTFPVVIGGFHFGVVRNSTTISDVSKNQIVPQSVWTRKPGAMPSCYTLAFEDPTLYDMGGMIEFVHGTWADIYLVSDPVGLPTGASSTSRPLGQQRGYSRYGAAPLSGSEGLNFYDFAARARAVGKRMLHFSEWLQVALGSPAPATNSDDLSGWTKTSNSAKVLTGAIANISPVPSGYTLAITPSGTAQYQNGYNTSLLGARDCVGNLSEWVDAGIANRPDGNQGFTWRSGNKTGESLNVMDFGSIFSYSGETATTNGFVSTVRMGGIWSDGVFAGSRAVDVRHAPWFVGTTFGSRFACDSL